MRHRPTLVALGALLSITILGCPLGRKNAELGDDCYSTTDCPMGTTGLVCASGCAGPTGCRDKSFCTKSCTTDTDCAGSKHGPMVCTSGKCAFKK